MRPHPIADRPTCSIPECPRLAESRGWCGNHYRQWWKRHRGNLPTLPTREPVDRFFEKVDFETGVPCWLWHGARNSQGYGNFWVGNGLWQQPHRWLYEFLYGPTPDGLEHDHLCRTPCCVLPDHIERVTRGENNRRGLGPAIQAEGRRRYWRNLKRQGKVSPGTLRMAEIQRSKTHCPKGHPYDEANTYYSKTGGRACRTCHRERERERQ